MHLFLPAYSVVANFFCILFCWHLVVLALEKLGIVKSK